MQRKGESFFATQNYFFGKPSWQDGETYFNLPGKERIQGRVCKTLVSLS